MAVHEMLGPWLASLLAVAAGIGLASGIVPAVRAAQLSVIDGLRRIV
jgi:ABC-type antimicrobial peptide transport system permease subunit